MSRAVHRLRCRTGSLLCRALAALAIPCLLLGADFPETHGENRPPNEVGMGGATVTRDSKKWHPVTVSFMGPAVGEQGDPNPFTDYRLDVTFSRGDAHYMVPGYYAADGNAAESGADSGAVWRVHFLPSEEGEWTYTASFRAGPGIAYVDTEQSGTATAFDGASGSFSIGPTDKRVPDNRARGLLQYVGKRYLQYAETGEYYIKGGADSPENMLGYADMDQTPPTHTFAPHVGDWREGDPVWRGDKGKGLIGGLNYLAGKGVNSVYFLTMNVKGDGKDVWPWTSDGERYRFDCSKLDQWEIVFSHMDRLGLALHVVTQEQENDQLLDGGGLGPERRLYYRELVARFGHHPALVWNLGEENTNTPEERRAFADFIRSIDAYDHPIVIHTYPSEREKVYADLAGFSGIDGPSLQLADVHETHGETLKWVQRSQEAGHPWVVCLDEIGPPSVGVKPDEEDPTHDEVRRFGLWGNLIAGGGGCEWFFQSDIRCEDWRSRDAMWNQTRYALEFFHQHLPFAGMQPRDDLVAGEGVWCLAKPGEVYAVYAPHTADVTMTLETGIYNVYWFNPREGSALVPGSTLAGPGSVTVGAPPSDGDKDWVVLVKAATR